MAVDLQDLSRRLFKTAETLWTNTGLRTDQYAVLALRQMEAKLLLVDAALKPTFTGRLKPTPDADQAAGAMFVPEIARFSRPLAQSALTTATPRSAVPLVPPAALPILHLS